MILYHTCPAFGKGVIEITPLTFINGLGPVALRYGLEEAIFLHAIVFWTRTNRSNDRNFRDGRWWTYNSVKGLTELFPWWSAKQIRRIINSCRDQGAILVANYNKDGRDRTIWYSPSDDLLALYNEDGMGICILPNGKMQMPNRADESAQMGTPLPCNNHVNNTPLPPKGGQGSTVYFLPLKDGTMYEVTQAELDHWQSVFPYVDVPQQFRSMTAWLEASTERRKTRRGIKRFIVSWLSRRADKVLPGKPEGGGGLGKLVL